MPRGLTFKIKKKEFTAIPVKVDRKKLYGWSEIVATDEQGRVCDLVTTDQTGTLIVSRGGTTAGILSQQREWVDRSDLKTVNDDGTPARLIPSSFSITINLDKEITEEEYLDYSITDFYELSGATEDFIKQIGNSIYTFGYTYLDSYETTAAFVMKSDGIPFLLLGYKNKFDYLCLGDCEVIDEDSDDFIQIDDDDIDFSMF